MIYFIQNETTKAIKIGYSTDVQKRLAQLQTAVAEKLILIGQITGEIEHERALHDRFREHHLRGEWFRGDAGLAEELAAMSEKSQWGLCEQYWAQAGSTTDDIASLVREATGFNCVIRSKKCRPESLQREITSWYCHFTHVDPSFREFYEGTDGHDYWSYAYTTPVRAAVELIERVFYRWKNRYKPAPTRLYCDAHGAGWRRERLREVLETATPVAGRFIETYVRQLTDTGHGLRVYWRYEPEQQHIEGLMFGWCFAAGFTSYEQAFLNTEHHFEGRILAMPEYQEQFAQMDLEEASEHLKIVG